MTIHDPQLLDSLERLGTSRFDGRVWRHMFNDHPPEMVNNRGARWNPGGVGAIYTSLTGDVALAEARHAIDSQPVRPRPRRRTLFEIDLTLENVCDLTGGRHHDVGLTDDDLVSDDPAACQAVGAAVAWLAWDGLLVPSARAAGENVVVLVDGLGGGAHWNVVASNDVAT